MGTGTRPWVWVRRGVSLGALGPQPPGVTKGAPKKKEKEKGKKRGKRKKKEKKGKKEGGGTTKRKDKSI